MARYDYHVDGAVPISGQVFVFGSNQAGIHGAGAARYATRYLGAQYRIGEGPTGQCYALPTKDSKLNPRTLAEIEMSVKLFLLYALQHSEQAFFVTRIGCGLAGYRDEQIAPMFRNAPPNCEFPQDWKSYLET